MSIRETWAVIEALSRSEFVFTGSSFQTPEQVEFSRKEAEQTAPKGWVVRQSAIEDAARNAMLVSHTDACQEIAAAGEYEPGTGGVCGDGWLCERGEQIRKLGMVE